MEEIAVAVMANGGEPGERKVMIAIDESEYSHYALMWVLDNLKESLAKSTLFIFMAQHPARNITFPASFGSARLYCAISTGKCLAISIFFNIENQVLKSLMLTNNGWWFQIFLTLSKKYSFY